MHVSSHDDLLVKERTVESKSFVLPTFSTDIDSIQLILGEKVRQVLDFFLFFFE